VSNNNLKPIYFFPNKLRLVGLFLIVIGIAFTVFRFYYGQKPDWLDIKVFAIYSSFLQKKYFSLITNNILEEVAGLSIFIGLFFIAFSKEKYEDKTSLNIRIHSLFYAIYLNAFITILAFIFIYGLGFVYFLVINIFSFLLLFIILFQYNLLRNKK
jgi:hypothetical protein